jgi:hypothetical protein
VEDETIILKLKLDKKIMDGLKEVGDYLFLWDEEKKIKYEVEDLIQLAIDKYIDHNFKPKSKRSNAPIEGLNDKESKIKNRFKTVLKKKGENQVWLIDKTGLPKSTVSQILSNNHEMSLRHFLLIWKTLGCPPIEKVLYVEKNKQGKI